MSRVEAGRPVGAGRLGRGVVTGLRCGAASHPGLVRAHNEDRVHVDPERGILLVVDGIGGEAAGEKAAEIAVDRMRQRLERSTGTPEERLREAIALANREILEAARTHPEWAGMSCVLTVALLEDGEVTVGHVGDSRLYALRGGAIDKITPDHSPVGEREDRGEIDEASAMRHPRRNEVYRSVGAEEHAPFDPHWIEIDHFRWAPDHALLLCSDGLTDLVSSAEIARAVGTHAADPIAVADALVAAALAAGGKDNVSVVFAAGPEFARVWSGNGAGSAGARPRSGHGGKLLGRGLFPFALGLIAGALLTATALWLWRAPAPGQSSKAPVASAPRVLGVGPQALYRTIGDALAAARAGDTVRVAPGRYAERIRLEEGVHVMSAVPHQAVLAPVSEGSGILVAVVAESLAAGGFRGFAIRGGEGAAIDVGIRVHASRLTVEDVTVSGAKVAGITIDGGGAASVLASRIHDNPGAGVLVRAGSLARIAGNRVEDNGGDPRRGEAFAGIELERGARAVIENNVIVGNAAAGIRGLPAGERALALRRNVFRDGRKSSPVPIVPLPAARGQR